MNFILKMMGKLKKEHSPYVTFSMLENEWLVGTKQPIAVVQFYISPLIVNNFSTAKFSSDSYIQPLCQMDHSTFKKCLNDVLSSWVSDM